MFLVIHAACLISVPFGAVNYISKYALAARCGYVVATIIRPQTVPCASVSWCVAIPQRGIVILWFCIMLFTEIDPRLGDTAFGTAYTANSDFN